MEIYTTKNIAQMAEHMDSSRSVSPTATWNSRKQTHNIVSREIDQAHGRAEGINILKLVTYQHSQKNPATVFFGFFSLTQINLN